MTEAVGTPLLWAGFTVFILAVLALYIFLRRRRRRLNVRMDQPRKKDESHDA